MTNPFQLFDKLTDEEYAALEASILEHGIQVPVIRDADGRIIDGHHRTAIGEKHGLDIPTITIDGMTDEQLEGLAFDLNTARRHLTAEQRRQLVVALREQGRSMRQIAGDVGVSAATVQRDVDAAKDSGDLVEPDRIVGADGREQPATKPKPAPKPKPAAENPKPKPEPAAASETSEDTMPEPVVEPEPEETTVYLAVAFSGKGVLAKPFHSEKDAQEKADKFRSDGYKAAVSKETVR